MAVKISPETVVALEQAGLVVGTPTATPAAAVPPTPAAPGSLPTGVTINLPGNPPITPAAAPVVQPTTPATAPIVPQRPASTQAILAQAGVTEDSLRQEMMQHGGITQATYSKLAGIDDAYLKAMYENVKLSQTVQGFQSDQKKAIDKSIYDAFGGEPNFKAVVAAIRPNMTQDEVNSINSMLDSGNQTTVNAAIQYLQIKQKQFAGDLNLTAPNNSGVVQGYTPMSKADYRAACDTDLYKKDPTHRAKVDAERLKAINWERQHFQKGTYWRKGADGNYVAL